MSNPMSGANPMQAASSVMNPTDMARMTATGQVTPNMTVEQWLGTMGISPQDPIQEAIQKIKGQAQNATPQGKMATMAGMAPQGGPPQQPTGGARSFRDEISQY